MARGYSRDNRRLTSAQERELASRGAQREPSVSEHQTHVSATSCGSAHKPAIFVARRTAKRKLAGQIARQLGAARVIGSTSSVDKARQLTAELGYDAAIVRGDGDLVAQLRRVAPDGIDAVLDSV